MSDLNPAVAGVKTKIEALISFCEQLKSEKNQLLGQNEKLQQELDGLKSGSSSQEQEIDGLKEKIKVLKMAGSLAGNDEKSSDAKLKINELLREIDKCIALLNR
jgi:predicted  nucleic acid-binding Zn-ribbon protein